MHANGVNFCLLVSLILSLGVVMAYTLSARGGWAMIVVVL
jgi:hypothetical protein